MTLFACVVFWYVNTAVTPMYREPDAHSTIESSAFFSEPVTVSEESGDWVRATTMVDSYSGWVRRATLCQRTTPFPSGENVQVARVNRCAVHLYAVKDTEQGPALTLPFESTLEIVDPTDGSAPRFLKVRLPDGRELYVHRNDVSPAPTTLSRQQMCDLSKKFLDLSYLWGGRSSFGYDCSGFTQMLYRQMGVHIPRNSRDQALWDGFATIPLTDASPGDLIFFGPAENRICHVGLCLGDGLFIHANGGAAEHRSCIMVSSLSSPEWNGSGRLAFRTARTLRVG